MRPAVWAEIDCEALAHNLTKAKELAPSSRVMAVIKANGYGHGIDTVAQALSAADAFAVARVDEAVFLRQAGHEKRIVVLEGFSDQEELKLHEQFHLEPVIHSGYQLSLVENLGTGVVPHFWLKVDTGMNRLGISPSDFEQACKILGRLSGVSAMSHLACADEPGHPMTEKQISLFSKLTSKTSLDRTLANSAAIMRWEQSHYEWIRPGIMLYGVSPFADQSGDEVGLRPVMNLYSRLISIKQVSAGDTVGYGGSFECSDATRVGVLAIGYGDGYPRHIAAGTEVLLNGKKATIIGRVSMDMVTVDLSNCADANVGDSCKLWGSGLPVEALARQASTIPYTLLCGVTRRVKFC